MKSYIKKLALGLLAITLVLGLAVGVHALGNLPEEYYAKRVTVPQLYAGYSITFDELTSTMPMLENLYLNTSVTWVSERGEVTLSMADMGVNPDSSSIYAFADNFMKEASGLEKIQVLIFGKTLETPLLIDEDAIKAAFAESGIEQGVSLASYAYDGSEVTIIPEQIGYGIDTALMAEVLTGMWNNYGDDISERYALPLLTSDPVVAQSLYEEHLMDVETIADQVITFQDEYGNTWDFSIAEHIDWLNPVENEDDTEQLELHWKKFFTYLDETIGGEISEEAQPVVITENEDGTYAFEGSARYGKEIDNQTIYDEVTAAINNPVQLAEEGTFNLDVLETAPEITIPDSLKERGVTDLLGYGYSDFSGSTYNRIHNINIGMETFNGTLVDQDSEFSFTALMGPIDESQNYLPELVILGDETIPEYGGGLCQVSSTMYRAALYLGLPITQRKNHSYAVSYYAYPYGYGLDATVYSNEPNLKFQNDTEGAILIQGYTDGNSAYFVFYGTKDDREVQMEGPVSYGYHSISEPSIIYTDDLAPGVREFDEYAHTGFQVDWVRTVTYPVGHYLYPEGYEYEETIHSTYEARPAKYL